MSNFLGDIESHFLTTIVHFRIFSKKQGNHQHHAVGDQWLLKNMLPLKNQIDNIYIIIYFKFKS